MGFSTFFLLLFLAEGNKTWEATPINTNRRYYSSIKSHSVDANHSDLTTQDLVTELEMMIG